jgi:anti-sigma B factor antagonist
MTRVAQTTGDPVRAGGARPETEVAGIADDLLIDVLDTASPTVMRLVGELDTVTAPRLRQELVALVEAGETRVVVDLASLTFVDSTGLGALVGGLKRFRAASGDLVLESPTPSVRKAWEITGLTSVVTIENKARSDVGESPSDGQARDPIRRSR